MKIIFDSEEERDKFLMGIAHSDHVCPSDFGCEDYCEPGHDHVSRCFMCWKKSGLEMEVNNG